MNHSEQVKQCSFNTVTLISHPHQFSTCQRLSRVLVLLREDSLLLIPGIFLDNELFCFRREGLLEIRGMPTAGKVENSN